MTFFECYPDETLLRNLGLNAKQLKGGHSQGRSKVSSKISQATDSIALIDEDPGSARDPNLNRLFSLQPAYSNRDIILIKDVQSNNRIVVIRPNLEAFILKIAKAQKVSLTAKTYTLSMKESELHDLLTPKTNSNKREKLGQFISKVSTHNSLVQLKKFLK